MGLYGKFCRFLYHTLVQELRLHSLVYAVPFWNAFNGTQCRKSFKSWNNRCILGYSWIASGSVTAPNHTTNDMQLIPIEKVHYKRDSVRKARSSRSSYTVEVVVVESKHGFHDFYRAMKSHTNEHTVRGRPTLKDVQRFRNGSVNERLIYERTFMSEPIAGESW